MGTPIKVVLCGPPHSGKSCLREGLKQALMAFHRAATHAVILAGDMSRVEEWKALCEELHLSVIAILQSDYDATSDRIDTETPILTGCVHYLERGQNVADRPIIQTLAKLLVNLVREKSD